MHPGRVICHDQRYRLFHRNCSTVRVAAVRLFYHCSYTHRGGDTEHMPQAVRLSANIHPGEPSRGTNETGMGRIRNQGAPHPPSSHGVGGPGWGERQRALRQQSHNVDSSSRGARGKERKGDVGPVMKVCAMVVLG